MVLNKIDEQLGSPAFWRRVWIVATIAGIVYLLLSTSALNPMLSEGGEGVEGTAPGNLAPDFELQTINGETVRLSDLRGSPIVLNFWASWCGPCRVETPHFQAFSERVNGDVIVLGVNQRESLDQIVSFQEEFGVTYPLLVDDNGRVNQTYAVFGLPTTYIIDANGHISSILPGGVTEAFLLDQVTDLIQSPASR